MKKIFYLSAVFAFLGVAFPVFADEQRTVGICGREYIAIGCQKAGRLPDLKYASCRAYDGNISGSAKYFCRARPGYVFWVGKCNSRIKYLQTGLVGDGIFDSTQWCLRAGSV
jgi:hypothetical protein